MDLTPIRISGKIKVDNRKAAIAERKSLNRPPGRPLKRLRDSTSKVPEPSSPPLNRSKKRSLRNIKSRRKMSNLERLPTELLENVFIFSMNLDLPRASPVIAGKLNSEIVYSRTILSAFSPTWDRYYGREDPPRSEGIEQENPTSDPFDGDPKLQSDVLRCRWATLCRILGTKDTWIQKHAQDRVFKPQYFLESRNHSLENQTIAQLSAVEYFNTDFEDFSTFVQATDGDLLSDHYYWDAEKDLTNGVEIPEKLLLGPWTEDMVKQLFWFIKAGARVDFLTTSGEVALEGLKTAILSRNIRALHLLEWAGLMEKLDVQTILWAFRSPGRELAIVNQLLSLGAVAGLHVTDQRRIQRELADMRDEAEEKGDQEQLDYVESIKSSSNFFLYMGD